MKPNKLMIGILVISSLFVGFILISAGVGTIFPELHKLTAPLICKGTVQVESVKYSYKPGQTGSTHHIYCDSASGDRKEITLSAVGVTGTVFSVVAFILIAFLMRNSLFFPKDFGVLAKDLDKKKNATPLERLSELKKMHEENLITTVEYEKKKAEIMKEL